MLSYLQKRVVPIRLFLLIGLVVAGLSVALTAAQPAEAAANFPNGFKSIAYSTSWGGSASSIQYNKITHINYAFASYTSDGTLGVPNASKLQQLVSLGHQNNVKVLISIGGWSGSSYDSTFEALAGNATSRTNFINNAMNIVSQYNLDGVDIDWEYPTIAANYTALMQGLRTNLNSRFGAGSKLLTTAVVSSGSGANAITSATYSSIDFFNVMAYDGGTPHANYQWSIDSFNYWVNTKGVPVSKVVLGVPFYGRPGGGSYASYVNQNPANAQVDCVNNDCYNGIPTIQRKTQYVMDRGGGGIMYWEVSQDTTNQYSLVNAIYETAMGGGPTPTTPPPSGNLALGRPATSSSNETTAFTPNLAVDGNSSTRWSSAFSDPQWIYVDLGTTYTINRVVLNWEAAYATAYQIQTSTNASTWTTVYSTTTGNGGVDDLAVSGSGRYVRMYGTARATAYGYSLFEFQVYGGGTPPPTTPPPTTPPPTTPPPGQAPYGGTPWPIPGTIQAENYDTGGEGVAYHDTTAGNSGSAYRSDGVDIEATTDSGGGHNVGWTAAGEWLEYTVNVAGSGTYTLNVRAASQSGGGSLHVEIDGTNVTGAVAIPSTGAWQTWTTVTRTGISLTAGQHVMRIGIDAAGFNLNWVSFTGSTPPSTNLALGRPATSSSNETTAFTPNLAVDGNTGTRWASAYSDPQWIRIDLGSTRTINRVVLRWEAAYGSAYQIQVSADGASWTTIRTVTGNTALLNDLSVSGSGRYIRMYGTARGTAWGYSLYEFEVYGN